MKPAADILERARSDFAKDDLARAVELLGTYSGPEKARVLRCALHLSGGTLEQLEYFMHAAQVDYRDVILFAEYDVDNRRVRDFSQGFEDL